tara:strand:- start:214 stop:582 length:369 start_codon:yes stop_codon:yes gene_type:complete
MSTLKVNTIQNTSGGSSSTPEEIASGRAKAWINFNGEGSISIRGSFNVSSISDNGTGDTTVNFQNSLGDLNYAAAGICGENTNDPNRYVGMQNYSATHFRVATNFPSHQRNDVGFVGLTFFR